MTIFFSQDQASTSRHNPVIKVTHIYFPFIEEILKKSLKAIIILNTQMINKMESITVPPTVFEFSCNVEICHSKGQLSFTFRLQ